MIKVISFDLDGTLVKSTFADAVWLEGVPWLYAQEKKVSLAEAKRILYKEYDSIGDQQKEWYDVAWWFNRFQLSAKWECLLDSYRHTIQIYPEVTEILDTLSQQYELIVLSNAKQEFIDIQLGETKLLHFFSQVFSSISDFNEVKKSPEVYQKVCNLLHIEPHECVHVGDHKDFDFQSPQLVGVNAFFLDRKHIEEGQHVIHSLFELEPLLNTLL